MSYTMSTRAEAELLRSSSSSSSVDHPHAHDSLEAAREALPASSGASQTPLLASLMGASSSQDAPALAASSSGGGGYTHLHATTPLMRIGTDGAIQEGGNEAEARAAFVVREKRDPSPQELRVEMMRLYVGAAETERAAHELALQESDPAARVMGVTLAPEWFLGKNNSEADMAAYADAFSKMSLANPNMMIAPGTGVWQERQSKGRFAGETVMHADAPFFFGGEQHTVQKQNEAGDTDHARDIHKGRPVDKARREKWWNKAPERQDPGSSFFEAGGVRFASDICRDHTNDRALKQVLEGGEAPADVFLMPSTGQYLEQNRVPVVDGGIALANDGQAAEAKGQTATLDGTSVIPEYFKNPDGSNGTGWLRNGVAPEGYDGYHRRKMGPGTTENLSAENTLAHMGPFRLPGR